MDWITTSGASVPPLGQGTWRMGEDAAQRTREVDALRAGIEAGLTLIDTAEAYAEGRSEELVRDAVADCRRQVFITTKVWPSHAGRSDVLQSLDHSLRRLGAFSEIRRPRRDWAAGPPGRNIPPPRVGRGRDSGPRSPKYRV